MLNLDQVVFIIESQRRDSIQTCTRRAFQLTRNAGTLSFEGVYLYRVLTVHGSADEDISVKDAELGFAKIIPNHWLEIIQGADHRYSKHQDELAAPVLKFIKECL